MAKLKSKRHAGALKALRQAKRRASRNKVWKKRIRLAVRKLLEAASKKDSAQAAQLLPGVSSLLDKAAKARVIHRRAAARKKSRLAKRVRALLPTAG